MILEIRLRNFRQYRDQTIRLQPGLNLITGANNAGKSTVFYALEYVLFGRVGGYKSVAGLMHPKEKTMGVELVFKDQADTIHRLQRIHEKPPKSRTKVVGHYTLKVCDDPETPESERYLLSSDFKDTEESLSIMLFKILGITKRLFETAVHTRQGQCASILAGAPQLDMVLGVTAAIAASDQMRAMALQAEKRSEAKPIIVQNIKSLNERLLTAEEQTKSVQKQLTENDKEQSHITEVLQQSSQVQSRIKAALDTIESQRQTLEEIKQAESGMSRLDESVAEVSTQLKEVTVEGGREKLATVVEASETKIADSIEAIREQDQQEKRTELAGELTQHIEQVRTEDRAVWEYDFSASTRERLQTKLADLNEQKKTTQSKIETLRKAISTDAAATDAPTAESPDGVNDQSPEPLELPSDFESLQTLKQENLLEEARNRTKQEHLGESKERLDSEAEELKETLQQLNREKASQEQELATMKASQDQASTFRKSAAALKWLQLQLRESAAEHLGEKILQFHKKLSGGDEFTHIKMDPKNYLVHVKTKGFKTFSPAHLFQGGGQCVMLGIAFKLALAQWLGNVPFLLLDEPTDGLDAQHLQTVLDGLLECPATRQILMITHVPWENDKLPVVQINRTKNVSEVQA